MGEVLIGGEREVNVTTFRLILDTCQHQPLKEIHAVSGQSVNYRLRRWRIFFELGKKGEASKDVLVGRF